MGAKEVVESNVKKVFKKYFTFLKILVKAVQLQ